MSEPELKHNKQGKCWMQGVVFKCGDCGSGVMCDVCHKHDEPRGECSECPECPVCVVEQSESELDR